jgi:hypothetical protein
MQQTGFKTKRTNARKFPGARGVRPDHFQARKEQASDRRQERDMRTPQQQLALLDHRLGKGIGAVAERKRLADAIDNEGKANQLGVKTLQPKGKK